MAWARYDDEFPGNWKTSTLISHGMEGLAAIGLHVLANCWSRHEGLAGFVPDFKPGQLCADQKLGARLAELLEDVGMLDVGERGWMLHDFDEYSDPNDDGTPAAEKKRRISEARRAAGSKGGKAKAAKQTASKPGGKSLANGWQTSTPDPDPVTTSSCTDDDRQTDPVGGPSVVTIEATAALLAGIKWEAANEAGTVDPAKRKGWERSTTAGILAERSSEIVHLLAVGYTPEQAAEHMQSPTLTLVKSASKAACSNPECHHGRLETNPESEDPARRTSMVPCPECNPSFVASGGA